MLYVTILAPRIFRWFLDFGKLVNPCNTALKIEAETVMFIYDIMMDIEGGWENHLFCQTLSSTHCLQAIFNPFASNDNFS
jgi:hypothetical protein